MPPNASDVVQEVQPSNVYAYNRDTKQTEYKHKIIWLYVALFGVLHVYGLYGLYLIFTSAKIQTTLFALVLHVASCTGTTAGAHRLWAHKSYKAKWQLQVLLVALQTLSYQMPAIVWARVHRIHHKYSDTDADPHNANRGLFFSHVGWLLVQKHPLITEKGQKIDFSDLYDNPILSFQKKYYTPLVLLTTFTMPTVIPMYFWNETFLNGLFVGAIFRYILSLNITFLVNSAGHFYGSKPYDKDFKAVENKAVASLTFGEGWHNYHHAFPWDYKTSELGFYKWNTTTAFIDFFAWLGWAYDLKTTNADMIEKRVLRTGDGSHKVFGSKQNDCQFKEGIQPNIWGWGDKDQTVEDKKMAVFFNQRHDE